MSARTSSFVIAIDGPVAAGKDTVADRVAAQLHTIHVNSGALYRMWTYLAADMPLDELETRVPEFIEMHHFRLERHGLKVVYFLDDTDITSRLYDNSISVRVSQVSRITTIRTHVNETIRQFAGKSSLVIDGRDATTVIFPDADLKVYLDTAFEIRVERRLLQLEQKGEKITFEELARQMRDRDESDKNKGIYSLTVTEGSFYVDATHLSADAAASAIVAEFQRRVPGAIPG